MNSSNADEGLDRTLRDRFALETFRPGQREVIEHVLAHRDVLCVMPTGGGKSLCYQLPAVLLEGVTLVVSPLIALMKDQFDALQARGIRATLINSTLDPAEQLAHSRSRSRPVRSCLRRSRAVSERPVRRGDGQIEARLARGR